jgi:Stress up-regulated Nod 19
MLSGGEIQSQLLIDRQTKERLGNGISLDPSGTGYMYRVAEDFPKDITVLYAESGVYDEEMKPIDIKQGLYNHHDIFIDTSQPPPAILSCGDGKAITSIPMSFFIRGTADLKSNRYTTADGGFKAGFYVAKDAPVMQMVDVVNYNNDTRTVYTISEMEYLPGKQEGFLQSISTGIDLGICSGKSGLFIYAPKEQSKFSFEAKEMTFERNGYILNAWGHLHDGGIDMVVRINGKEVCTSIADYGGPGHETEANGEILKTISGMSLCSNAIEVAKGDKLSITANFDMKAHPA